MRGTGILRELAAFIIVIAAAAAMVQVYPVMHRQGPASAWDINESCPDVRRVGRRIPSGRLDMRSKEDEQEMHCPEGYEDLRSPEKVPYNKLSNFMSGLVEELFSGWHAVARRGASTELKRIKRTTLPLKVKRGSFYWPTSIYC